MLTGSASFVLARPRRALGRAGTRTPAGAPCCPPLSAVLKLRGKEEDGEHPANRKILAFCVQGNDEEFRALAYAEVVAAVGLCRLVVKLW